MHVGYLPLLHEVAKKVVVMSHYKSMTYKIGFLQVEYDKMNKRNEASHQTAENYKSER